MGRMRRKIEIVTMTKNNIKWEDSNTSTNI